MLAFLKGLPALLKMLWQLHGIVEKLGGPDRVTAAFEAMENAKSEAEYDDALRKIHVLGTGLKPRAPGDVSK